MTKDLAMKRKQGRPHLDQQLDLDTIVETAISVFAEKGYDGTRLSDIARRAAVNKSLINYHFGSKEALWRRAVQRLSDKLFIRFEEARATLKDVEGIPLMRAYARQVVYASAEYPEFYKIVFHEMCSPSNRTEWLTNVILNPIHALGHTLRQSVASKHALVTQTPPANFMMILIGASNAFFVSAHVVQKQYGIDVFDLAQIEAHADIVVNLLFPKPPA